MGRTRQTAAAPAPGGAAAPAEQAEDPRVRARAGGFVLTEHGWLPEDTWEDRLEAIEQAAQADAGE